jgi:hypothetical protein
LSRCVHCLNCITSSSDVAVVMHACATTNITL